MGQETENILGRKIFFLYPQAIVQNNIIAELIQQEFETYIIRDEKKLRRLFKKYPDSIVFVNLYDGIAEKDWEAWIRGVMADTELAGVDIGIVVCGDDEALRRKYLSNVKVRCGYTVVKTDINLCIRQLMDILKDANAKGRRKYIRANTSQESNITVNLPVRGTFITGTILAISVAGFSCVFQDDPGLTKNSLFQDLQLKLQSVLIKAEGIVFGAREDGEKKAYVLLFTKRMDPDARARIRKFIQSNLQAKIYAELN
ncbi:MAG: pilus assembly protein PilZ [Treponema sp.]|jgi:hypothetical protein|nr:pilus assembly protein PilZ [Treponema sp.]